MKKSEYEIDKSMGMANKIAGKVWKEVKIRKLEYHSIYDIRMDKKREKNYDNWLCNKELGRVFTSEYDDKDWSQKIYDFQVVTFEGFVNRIIQQKRGEYYIELKGINEDTFDIETDWLGCLGFNPILPEAKQKYRYAYQPYILGNAVKVQYIRLSKPDSTFEKRVYLHIEVENNEYSKKA